MTNKENGLLPCFGCRSVNIEFTHIQGVRWGVHCIDCDLYTDPDSRTKEEAQVHWNKYIRYPLEIHDKWDMQYRSKEYLEFAEQCLECHEYGSPEYRLAEFYLSEGKTLHYPTPEPSTAQDVNTELLEASKELVARWHTPLWKEVPATAVYINKLEQAIARAEQNVEGLDHGK